jgi:predicted porin
MTTGHHVRSIGGSLGGQVIIKGLEIHGSGYYGEGLGMVSAQDGTFGGGTDAFGEERTHFGFLGQVTYQLTPSVKLGANYGQTRQNQTDNDKVSSFIQKKKQESAVAMVVYNLNKFTQFIAEYSYAQDTWHDRETQHSNNVNIGTMFYW